MRKTSSRRPTCGRTAATNRSARARTSGPGCSGSSPTRTSIVTGPRSDGSRKRTSMMSRTYLYRKLHDPGALGRSAEDELMDLFGEGEVVAAVEALPEAYRMAVLLADVEGFSYKEIAEILDIPIGTVMSRLHRGKRCRRSCTTSRRQRTGRPSRPVRSDHSRTGRNRAVSQRENADSNRAGRGGPRPRRAQSADIVVGAGDRTPRRSKPCSPTSTER